MTVSITFTGIFAITYADGSVRELKRMTAREAWDEYSREWEKHNA